MSIGRICPKCHSSFRIETNSCPTCQVTTRFQVRLRLPGGGWATRTTTVRREAEAFLAKSQARVQTQRESQGESQPPTLKEVWVRYYAYTSQRNRSALDDFARWHHIEPVLGDHIYRRGVTWPPSRSLQILNIRRIRYPLLWGGHGVPPLCQGRDRPSGIMRTELVCEHSHARIGRATGGHRPEHSMATGSDFSVRSEGRF